MTRDSNSDAARVRPLICAPGAGPTLGVLGVPHVYKAMASDTPAGNSRSGSRSCRREAARHTHTREDEAFYVMSGEVVFDVQRESEGAIEPLRLGTGGFLFAPRNLRHGYRNTGPLAAHLLVFANPGAGLDHMFAAFDAAGKDSGGSPSPDTLAAIATQHGVMIHPPAG